MKWYERAAARGYHPAASRLAALRAANPSLAASLAAKSTAAPSRAAPAETPVDSPKADSSASATAGDGPVAVSPGTASASTTVEPGAVAQAPMAGRRSASAWLADLDPDHYTLQVLSHTDEASVRRYLDENFDDGEAGYFAFQLDGKTWYTVVYGEFANHSQAKTAGQGLATRLRGPEPWVRKIAIIQKAAIR